MMRMRMSMRMRMMRADVAMRKEKLILHFQREIKHNSDTDGERRCVLSDWWLSEPPRGVSVGASLKLWGRIAKIH